MPARCRKTLKAYFENGSLPSADQFADLIDSMLSMRDEGFEKTPKEGFKIAQLPEGRLISFFEDITIDRPLWSVKIDLKSSQKKLTFLNAEDEEIFTLTPKGKVGVKQNHPDFDLTVGGTIASRGRIGANDAPKYPVYADGQWHAITPTLEGCNAFEIMAGVGKPKSGKYALMHALALKTFDARGKIVYHQAHYGSRCNRLKLGWKKEKDKRYRLQLKTKSCYGTCGSPPKPIEVKYYITQLWFDNLMRDCCPGAEDFRSRPEDRI